MPSARRQKNRKISGIIRDNGHITSSRAYQNDPKLLKMEMDLTPDSPITKIDPSKINRAKIKVIPKAEVLARKVHDITALAQAEPPPETFKSVVDNRQNVQKTEFLKEYKPDHRKRVQREPHVERSGPSGARGHKYYSS